MKLIKIKNGKDNEEVYLADFEDIVQKVSIIKFNKDTIVIPDICVITPKGKDTFIKRLLNSSEDFVVVDPEEFDKMLQILDVIQNEKYVITKESRVIPKYTILINLNALKNNAVFIKSSRNILEVNGIVFTDSELDYQGFGLFTSKEPIFLTFDELAHIKEILTIFSED